MSNLILDLLARKVVDSRGEFEQPAYPEGGVDAAIDLVDTLIKPELLGENALEQERLDALLREIDGTKNYSRIGGTRPW